MQHDIHTFRPKPDGSVDPAGEAGWFLQRERERTESTLEAVAKATGIHQRHLEAIELGDLTGLPRRGDTLRMVGAYAEHLGLDPQPLVLHYAQFLPRHMPGVRRRRAPHPLSSATIIEFPLSRRLASFASGAGGIVATCLGAVMLFGVASWIFSPHSDLTAFMGGAEVASLAPVENAGQPELDSAAPPDADPKDVPVASITTITEQPLDENAAQNGANVGADADAAATGLDGLTALIERQVAPEARAPIEGERQYGAENQDSRVLLKAEAPVWIRIEDGKGNVVVTQTLMTGDTYKVPNQPGLVIIARDGGLLSYEVDGVARGSLGKDGEILVGRPLDADKLAKKG